MDARRRLVDAACVALAIVAAATLYPPLWGAPIGGVPYDLASLWAAGAEWAQGNTPYGTAPQARGEIALRPLFYPPAMRAVLEPLGRMDFEDAREAAALLSIGLWLAVCAHAARQLRGKLFVRTAAMAIAGLAIACLPVRSSIEIGQMLVVFAAGLALLDAGAGLPPTGPDRRRSILLAAGIFVLCMKPTLGLVVLAAVLPRPSMRRQALAGVAVAGLACLIAAWPDPIGVGRAYLATLAIYGSFPENAVPVTAGPLTLLVATGLPALPPLAGVGVAALAAAWAGCRADISDRALPAVAALLFVAFTQTHHADLLLLLPFARFAFRGPRRWRFVCTLFAAWTCAAPFIRQLADHGLRNAVIAATSALCLLLVYEAFSRRRAARAARSPVPARWRAARA